MIRKGWYSNNQPASLYVTLKCNGKKRFYLNVADATKPNSLYAKREMVVEGSRTIFFSFPVTTEKMVITIINMGNKQDTDFVLELEQKPLRTYNIWTNEETRNFLRLCFDFCQVAGYESANPNGRLWTDGYFNIRYYPVIRDGKGNPLSTPARIGHNTGNIDVAKNRFERYTFAERVVILLHEFSHKFRNPKMGLAIENETGADINAIYIYLGLGFSKIDCINVFANVFLKAQTPGNIKRMRAIMDYIEKFEQGDYAQIA